MMMRTRLVTMLGSLLSLSLGPIVRVVVRVVWQWSKDEVRAGLIVVVDLVHNIIFSPR